MNQTEMTQNENEECQFNFDLERMKKAVEGPSIELPKGLNREELREYLKKRAEEIKND